MNYSDYLQTDYWKAVTLKVKERAGFRCQLCNSQHDLCAHHRTYDHRGRELEFLADLVCLCRRCHEIFHGKATSPVVVPYRSDPKPETRPIDVSSLPTFLTLDRASIAALKSPNGAFTGATVRALGLSWSTLDKGWTHRLRGTRIHRDAYALALAGRLVRSSNS